jgi:hypothetical protein
MSEALGRHGRWMGKEGEITNDHIILAEILEGNT